MERKVTYIILKHVYLNSHAFNVLVLRSSTNGTIFTLKVLRSNFKSVSEGQIKTRKIEPDARAAFSLLQKDRIVLNFPQKSI